MAYSYCGTLKFDLKTNGCIILINNYNVYAIILMLKTIFELVKYCFVILEMATS